MAIKTEKGNAVKFLGMSDTIREDLLKAILGSTLNGAITVNEQHKCYLGLSSTEPKGDGSNIAEPTDWNYTRLLLSSGGENGVTFTSDYLTLDGDTAINERKDSAGNRISTEIKFNRSTEAWLKEDGETPTEYKYFFMAKAKKRVLHKVTVSDGVYTEMISTVSPAAINTMPGVKTTLMVDGKAVLDNQVYSYQDGEQTLYCAAAKESGLMAWGELKEPITVGAKNVVPLFEEGKFRLYFPAPGEVETIVDAAAAADAVPTETI